MHTAPAIHTHPTEADGSAAGIYLLLARAFREPFDPAALRVLEETGVAAWLERYGCSQEDLDALIADADACKEEFTTVFLGPGSHVSPYASVHCTGPKEGRLWGDSTVWLRAFIKDLGLRYSRKEDASIPDHVAAVFELLYRIEEAAAHAVRDGDRAKKERLDNAHYALLSHHVNHWISRFRERVAAQANRPLYPALAGLACDVVQREHQRLQASR